MKKKLSLRKVILGKGILGCINALALMLVIQSANSACVWVVHQPEFPEEAKRFQKKYE